MPDRPNIVVVMTDQQRADVSAREGFPLDTTPFLDELARQGQWFDHAYTAVPVCAPARVSFLTGRFPSAHRVRENRGIEYATYQKDLIDVVHAQGYAAGMIGKNHSHLKQARLDHWFPLSHNAGFQPQRDAALFLDRYAESEIHPEFLAQIRRFQAHPVPSEGEDRRTPIERDFDLWITELTHRTSLAPTPFPVECQGPYRAVSDAQEWISSLAGAPFFLWLSFAEPHNPYQVPEPYYSLFPPEILPANQTGLDSLVTKGFKFEWTHRLGKAVFPDYDEIVPRARSNYFGMLRLIDDQVRRFVEFIDRQGLRENTLLVFVSDHGDFAGEYGLVRKGPEMPEVLMRVPLFFVGPGVKASARPQPAHVSLVDLMPTLCEALGVPLPPGVQGRSLWPLLTGGDYPAEEFASVYAEQGFGGLHYTDADELSVEHCLIYGPKGPTFDELNTYSQSGTMRMLRKGDWKLVMDMLGHGQLYNLAKDPFEIDNLYGRPEFADVERVLLVDLLAWTLRAADPLPYPKDKYI
ncbi:MAG TPA: sulfatase-like hydrolase/transferase, partial [Chloroflexota bacterium]|nr:sulfatase-like hydrolase/transferase [Chloroflexota bacterium]